MCEPRQLVFPNVCIFPGQMFSNECVLVCLGKINSEFFNCCHDCGYVGMHIFAPQLPDLLIDDTIDDELSENYVCARPVSTVRIESAHQVKDPMQI